ncbi:reverse transcriptase [Gossypium australe]|uniref:Reverse transcriptase n=1 Tax=Gossypium australe TaxID=47621 RepID=A0A5B6X3G0_9ROSI|nr:reverse transcriptase [Gossypium australe]
MAPKPRMDVHKPNEFKGTRSVTEVDNFLWGIEQYFCAKGIMDDTSKVNTTAMYFTEVALLWWHRRSTDVRHGGTKIKTWKEFQREFKTKFYLEYVEDKAWEKLHRLHKIAKNGDGKAKNSRQKKKSVPLTCFHCDDPHMVRDCPKKAVLSAMKGDDKATNNIGSILGGAQDKSSYGLIDEISYLAILKANEVLKSIGEILKEVGQLLQYFRDVMFGELPKKLLSKKEVDHRIELLPNMELSARSPYCMSMSKLEELQNQLKELLDVGFIRPSKFPFSVPVLFQKKHGGSLRMCANYRALNKINVKNRYPIPLIVALFDQLGVPNLVGNELYVKEENCSLAQYEVPFLGHVVGAGKIRMDERKICAIVDWEPTTNVMN